MGSKLIAAVMTVITPYAIAYSPHFRGAPKSPAEIIMDAPILAAPKKPAPLNTNIVTGLKYKLG